MSTTNDYCNEIWIQCEECGHKSASIEVYSSLSKKAKDKLFNDMINSWNLI